jgi:PilZ domain
LLLPERIFLQDIFKMLLTECSFWPTLAASPRAERRSVVQVAVEQDGVQRRRYVRVKSPELLVAWQANTTRSVSRLETLGLGGMFVLTSQAPPIRSMVKLLLDLPQGEVRARAVVRRVNPLKGMGVEFISMTQEHRARLNKSLVAMSTGN